MNGAEALIGAAAEAGIDVCFANPGTTEMPLVLALDSVPGIRPVLCLHENVATGAADGYARMTGRPAMCLLHLGPGLANGLTNLHNARRAHTPVLNVVGEHASWHLPADPLLASDIEEVARMVSCLIARSAGPDTTAAGVVKAITEARSHSGVATLIVPHDDQIGPARATRLDVPPLARRTFSHEGVTHAAKALKTGRSAILLGGDGLSQSSLGLAGRIAAATGAELLCDTFFARMERGGDLPSARKLPYFPDLALALTRTFDHVVIAGTRRPVAFFGYPGFPSYVTTEAQTVSLAGPTEDVEGALSALTDELHAPAWSPPARAGRPPEARGALTPLSTSTVIARMQPEQAIVMDEALTVGIPYFDASRTAPRFTHLMLTGGAIGQGPSAATGAALACPGRKVLNFQSDGCGAYSVQALWTQAREQLDVVTVIGSNRSYNILKVELERAGVRQPGPAARSLASLDAPYLDWVRIGEGFGVPSVAVETAEALARELERALAARGPRLIEAIFGG